MNDENVVFGGSKDKMNTEDPNQHVHIVITSSSPPKNNNISSNPFEEVVTPMGIHYLEDEVDSQSVQQSTVSQDYFQQKDTYPASTTTMAADNNKALTSTISDQFGQKIFASPLRRRSSINFKKLEEFMEGAAVASTEKLLSSATSEDDNYRNNSNSYSNTSSVYNKPQLAISQSQIYYYAVHQGMQYQAKSLIELNTKAPLVELLAQKDFWLDLSNVDDDQLKVVGSLFNVHPLTTEDIIQQDAREKVEYYKNYIFLSYSMLVGNQVVMMYVLVYDAFIISVHFCEDINVDIVRQKVVKRLGGLNSFMNVNSRWIAYAIIDQITDQYIPIIRDIELEVDAIDDLVLVVRNACDQSDMLRRIALGRKQVMNMQRLLQPKNDMLRGLMKRVTSDRHWKDVNLYLGDVQDHVIALCDLLVHLDTTVNRSHANYLAQINIDITKASNTSNDIMARLTALAGILIPLNLITSMWGMNVRLPGMVGFDDSFVPFIVILSVCLMIMACGYLFIYKPISKAHKKSK
ncbi:hypothetical protein MP228_003649 [Amoeboaphelidium protococcarum]|nr:hypothetical protein MP228_003649 [Amoeboaphelidium protococcarum]